MDKAEKKALQERYNDISQMAFEAFATYYLCDGILEEMLEDHPFLAPARAIQEQVKNQASLAKRTCLIYSPAPRRRRGRIGTTGGTMNIQLIFLMLGVVVGLIFAYRDWF